uniref:Uncharacterized protein n=1 Tax=Anguilla anguilla TaxID=7936 RepID=A0A0E9U0A4_ANGAN
MIACVNGHMSTIDVCVCVCLFCVLLTTLGRNTILLEEQAE